MSPIKIAGAGHMEDRILKIRHKTLLIITILVVLFPIYSLMILPESVAFHIVLLIDDIIFSKFDNVVSYIFLILSIGMFIIYIYKFIILYTGLKKHKLKIENSNLLSHYLKYSKTNIMEIIFYSFSIIIYISMLIFNLNP